jgi:hypothetical protein
MLDDKLVAITVQQTWDGDLVVKDPDTGAEIYRGPDGPAMRDAVWNHFHPGEPSEEIAVPRRAGRH